MAGLGHFAWLLEAQLLDNRNFSIVEHKSVRKHYAYEQPKLAHLLQSVSAEYIGWRIGATPRAAGSASAWRPEASAAPRFYYDLRRIEGPDRVH